MSENIFLSPPHMGQEERKLIDEVFASNFIAPAGPMLRSFEKEMAEFLEIPYVVAVASGTAAIHLALRHIGINPGDVVLASTLTFIGSVSPVTFEGGELVFIDSDPQTWNMDPDCLATGIEKCIQAGKTIKAVIPTDLYGQCVDLERIRAICSQYEIPVLIDSAESLGATYKGKPSGSGAYASIYSFNGNKIITTSGGGLLASEDKQLIDHARKLATQSRDDFPYYHHSEIGFNYRMSNVLAAIGLGQLRVLEKRVQRKREINKKYRELFAEIPGISFMPEADYGRSNNWLTVMQVDQKQYRVTPQDILLALAKQKIEVRPVWKPMHLQPVFSDNLVINGHISEDIFKAGVCLPSGTAMSDNDIERIARLIITVLEEN